MKETTYADDWAFRVLCQSENCTFKTCMEFLRKHNKADYRDASIMDIPTHLKEKVRTQCLLEGLI